MEIPYQKDTIGYLDITFHPKWDYIAITRLYVESFLIVNLEDINNINKVSIIASELLENATKYSSDAGIRMIVKKLKGTNEIILSVINKTIPAAAEALVKRIDEMNNHKSLEYYILRMKESVKNKNASAMLGLARMYHECRARITAIYDSKEGVIEVRAILKV
jgi:hypothetical protein